MQEYKIFRKKILRENLQYIRRGKELIDLRAKMQCLKGKLDKSVFIKIINSCPTKDHVERLKRQSTEWEKLFVNYEPNKRLES